MKLGEKLKENMGKPREEMSACHGYDCSDVELDPSSSDSDASQNQSLFKKTSQDLNRKEVKKMLKRSKFQIKVNENDYLEEEIIVFPHDVYIA